jgi:hypothetical protein
MFCGKCGADNPDDATFCRSCGQRLRDTRQPLAEAGQSGAVEIPLATAILTAIFCCQPFGIVAIIYAAMAQGRLSEGNVDAARDLAGKSWYWIKLSLGIGIVWTVIVLLIMAGTSGSPG